jgi:hypothetical protein
MWDNLIIFGSIFAVVVCVIPLLFPRTTTRVCRPPTLPEAGSANATASKSQTRQNSEARKSPLIEKLGLPVGKKPCSFFHPAGADGARKSVKRKGERLMHKQTR